MAAVGTAADVGINLGMGFWWLRVPCCPNGARCGSFYLTFEVTQDETEDRLLYALGDRQWDIPGLRTRLETIVPEPDVMDAYEVDRELARYRGS